MTYLEHLIILLYTYADHYVINFSSIQVDISLQEKTSDDTACSVQLYIHIGSDLLFGASLCYYLQVMGISYKTCREQTLWYGLCKLHIYLQVLAFLRCFKQVQFLCSTNTLGSGDNLRATLRRLYITVCTCKGYLSVTFK